MDAEQDRPRLGIWDIKPLPGAAPNGHTAYQVTRNDQPVGEPFIFRRAAHKAKMRAVQIEGMAVQEYMRENRQSIVREFGLV